MIGPSSPLKHKVHPSSVGEVDNRSRAEFGNVRFATPLNGVEAGEPKMAVCYPKEDPTMMGESGRSVGRSRLCASMMSSEFLVEFTKPRVYVPGLVGALTSYNAMVMTVVVFMLKCDPGYLSVLNLYPKVESALQLSSFLGATIGSIFCGFLGDITGRQPAMLIAILMQILGAAGSALGTWGNHFVRLNLLILFRIIAGMGAGGCMAIIYVAAAESDNDGFEQGVGGAESVGAVGGFGVSDTNLSTKEEEVAEVSGEILPPASSAEDRTCLSCLVTSCDCIDVMDGKELPRLSEANMNKSVFESVNDPIEESTASLRRGQTDAEHQEKMKRCGSAGLLTFPGAAAPAIILWVTWIATRSIEASWRTCVGVAALVGIGCLFLVMHLFRHNKRSSSSLRSSFDSNTTNASSRRGESKKSIECCSIVVQIHFQTLGDSGILALGSEDDTPRNLEMEYVEQYDNFEDKSNLKSNPMLEEGVNFSSFKDEPVTMSLREALLSGSNWYKLVGTLGCNFLNSVMYFGFANVQPSFMASYSTEAAPFEAHTVDTLNQVVLQNFLVFALCVPAPVLGVLLLRCFHCKSIMLVTSAVKIGVLLVLLLFPFTNPMEIMVLLMSNLFLHLMGPGTFASFLGAVTFPVECRATFSGFSALGRWLGGIAGIFLFSEVFRLYGPDATLGLLIGSTVFFWVICYFFVLTEHQFSLWPKNLRIRTGFFRPRF